MSFLVQETDFDVAIIAGPRVTEWPSIGVRVVSTACAEMGLKVGLFGGKNIRVKGVIPLPSTGGLILAEDLQKRIHRIRARAIVRMTESDYIPDPFPGWRTQGLVPLSSAKRLFENDRINWNPATVILGTGNSSFRFGSDLLQSAVKEVYCVETFSQWEGKRFSAWEVEKRRFEMNGGRVIEGNPVQLNRKSALIWELRIEDSQGTRVIDVARVVAGGPFRRFSPMREHPPSSLLFELEQTAKTEKKDAVEGYVSEEAGGRFLSSKIIRALVADLSDKKDIVDKIQWKGKSSLRFQEEHFYKPFTPAYKGKWMHPDDAKTLKASPGVPQKDHLKRMVAGLECLESIDCDICQKVCPEGAIAIDRKNGKFLEESKCTACGLCVTACPSNVGFMLHEGDEGAKTKLVLNWRGSHEWNVGDLATLLNRRGEAMGSGRILKINPEDGETSSDFEGKMIELEVPSHLSWEARSIRPNRPSELHDEFRDASEEKDPKVPITVDGEKRLVREGRSVGMMLFETGYGRPEDTLICPDGSCGLCEISVDGVKKLACQTQVRKGMAVKLSASLSDPKEAENYLCPCQKITKDEILEKLKQGKFSSPEALQSITQVGEGECRGLLCMASFQRLLTDEGLDVKSWVDWRFPWSRWVLNPGAHD